ncbi:L,D-transpeptidase family protein [Lachnospiraceae bacterium 62-35]
MEKDDAKRLTGRDAQMKREIEEAVILEKELERKQRDEINRIVTELEEEELHRKGNIGQEDRRRQNEEERKGNKNVSKEDVSKMTDSEKKKKMSGKKIALTAGIMGAVAVGAAGGYFLVGLKYQNAFLPGTVINGADVSGMNINEAENAISTEINHYALAIKERGDKTEIITREEINLRAEFDGSLERILDDQNPNRWLPAKISGSNYEIETMMSYDENLLDERIRSLECLDETKVIKPANAYVGDYVSGEGYVIIPEKEGTELKEELVREKINSAIQNLKPEILLDEEGCYKEPQIKFDDPSLKERADNLNRYVKVKVTYKFGDKQEVLDGDTIRDWLVINGEDMDISFDSVKDYVQMLATKYNTAYRAKNLQTSYNQAVTIDRGSYGWRIDQASEAEALMAIIQSGESQEREPIYSQTAASHGENDYGNTYVEINLSAQHLFFYKNGQLVVESDFVSGNVARGFTTPPGAYPLTYKTRNATLRGQGYATPVSYWMPFNGGIGMHDAKWRGSFGGSIYRTNGSHGCINLPASVAKTIYENIEKGTPVLCYNMGGTESRTSVPSVAPAAPPAPPVPPAEETENASETPAEGTPEAPVQTEPGIPADPGNTGGGQETPPPVETPAPAGPGDQVGGGTQAAPSGPGAEM